MRFPTALCLPLVVAALALQSPVMLLGLAGVAVVAGFTPRHPFDLLWNSAVRRLVRSAPRLPPNPRRRRHAFKLGGGLLIALAGLVAAGMTTPAVVLGAMLIAACTSASVLNFCLPSEALALLERRRRAQTRLI